MYESHQCRTIRDPRLILASTGSEKGRNRNELQHPVLRWITKVEGCRQEIIPALPFSSFVTRSVETGYNVNRYLV